MVWLTSRPQTCLAKGDAMELRTTGQPGDEEDGAVELSQAGVGELAGVGERLELSVA